MTTLPYQTVNLAPCAPRRFISALHQTWLIITTLCLISACEESLAPSGPTHPQLLVTPDHQELILSRIGHEPYAGILAGVQKRAAQAYQEDPDPEHWNEITNGQNAQVAQLNAFLAWLFADEAAAKKARDFLSRLKTDWETIEAWDANIRMTDTLMAYTSAHDLLLATPWYSPAEAAQSERTITALTDKVFTYYLEKDFIRLAVLGFTQNNHPIRTAAAIGYVALAFPEHPAASRWANWAFSELSYLWGPHGKYVQPDGGVSEGPFYFGFAWGVSTSLFIALDNLFDVPQVFARDCRNRMDVEPWADHGCQDGEPFTFNNFLYDPLYHAAAEWSVALRLPWGMRPPLGDGAFNPLNGNALLTGFGGAGLHRWDWEHNRDRPREMFHGVDLSLHHLIYFDDTVAAEEPPWTTRFMSDAGDVIFRSDWSDDARYLLLVGEAGAARQTVHDHVDGTSLSLAAYGEYLLLDPGRFDTAAGNITATAPAHNVLLIEGQTTPPRGILANWGDADAWIHNTHDGQQIEHAEVHQDYQQAHLERAVTFVEGRYFVVCDRLQTSLTTPREHTWRMNGYAGHGSGGLFVLRADGARWQRERAGVDVFVGSTAPELVVEEPPFVERQIPHIHSFDLNREQTHHAVIDAKVKARAPGFLALLLPYRVSATLPEEQPRIVERLELGPDVVAWTVSDGQVIDLALLREPNTPEHFELPNQGHLETDAALVVLRLSGPRPFALMARGQRLILNGKTRLSASSNEAITIEESQGD